MEVPAFYLVVDVPEFLHYVDGKWSVSPPPKKMLPGEKNATFDSGWETSSFNSWL